jgi:threonine aldolase
VGTEELGLPLAELSEADLLMRGGTDHNVIAVAASEINIRVISVTVQSHSFILESGAIESFKRIMSYPRASSSHL